MFNEERVSIKEIEQLLVTQELVLPVGAYSFLHFSRIPKLPTLALLTVVPRLDDENGRQKSIFVLHLFKKYILRGACRGLPLKEFTVWGRGRRTSNHSVWPMPVCVLWGLRPT